MVHPIRMMANVRKNDRFVCHTIQQVCSRTIQSHIRRGHEACALNHIQFRVLFNKLLYRGKMFLQGTHGIHMYKKERFRASGRDMAMSLSKSRKD